MADLNITEWEDRTDDTTPSAMMMAMEAEIIELRAAFKAARSAVPAQASAEEPMLSKVAEYDEAQCGTTIVLEPGQAAYIGPADLSANPEQGEHSAGAGQDAVLYVRQIDIDGTMPRGEVIAYDTPGSDWTVPLCLRAASPGGGAHSGRVAVLESALAKAHGALLASQPRDIQPAGWGRHESAINSVFAALHPPVAAANTPATEGGK